MTNRHTKSTELVRIGAILEGDRVLLNAADHLRALNFADCAGKIENLRLELAKRMSAVQDEAYEQAFRLSPAVSRRNGASKN